MAVVWEVARHDQLPEADRRDLLNAFDVVLALKLVEATMAEAAPEWETDARIDALLVDRQAARGAKQWAKADRIRDELAAEGIEIVDTQDGPRWRRRSTA